MTRLILAAAIALSLSVTGCGRKGAPSPPGPAADITYPHAYPSE